MKKDSVKCIVVLSAICLICAATLAAVNHITAPIIEENKVRAVEQSLKAVLPDAEEFESLELSDDIPNTVTGVYRDTKSSAFAVTLETVSSYSKSPMAITVAISAEGNIIDTEITNYSETKDFMDYPDRYIGKDSSLSGVDTYSGVTISSTAFKGAIGDAFEAINLLSGGPSKEESALIAVLPEGAELEELEVSETMPETVTGIYKDANGSGYAVTLETSSDYSTAPMAITVGISADGVILGIEITNYSETKDFGAFPDSFIGKGEDLSDIDLVSGVTYSSQAFKNAVGDAFKAFKEVQGE